MAKRTRVLTIKYATYTNDPHHGTISRLSELLGKSYAGVHKKFYELDCSISNTVSWFKINDQRELYKQSKTA